MLLYYFMVLSYSQYIYYFHLDDEHLCEYPCLYSKMLKDVGMTVPKSKETRAVYMQQHRD